MADWNDYRYFLAVARQGTLAGAARDLGVEHTTVSRRIAALEAALDTKLFVRTRDGFVLTDGGRAALVRVERAAGEFEQLERGIGEANECRGIVRLATSEGFAPYVIRSLVALRERYPEIVVEVHANNAVADLTRNEADIAIRIAPTPHKELVMRKVGSIAWGIYGSESYFARAGMPSCTTELAGHDVIAFDEQRASLPGAQWLEAHAKGARIVMRGNGIIAALNAAMTGLGLAIVPCFVAATESTLRRVPGEPIGARDVFVVVHPDVGKLARVRAVMDFFIERIAADGPVLAP
ncbi:MAG TPA: LysR family transcriptional regulator [Kofleriaceae bacterium]|nr:LysR family transcriptional regulator [Kofleriaceae bacterium]